MAMIDKIHQHVRILPEALQAEVLDFVEFLLSRISPDQLQDDLQELNHTEWSNFSLNMAMRGMEDEDGPEYTLADLKEQF
ncbi:MAG: DUF2281 domain-containing protein [Chloroflexi bacterium]|nr:MAG: DUF2281 domain-containing protein [Chloroflexota bacterium]